MENKTEKFGDGDILCCWWKDMGRTCKWISILKGEIESFANETYFEDYASLIVEPQAKLEFDTQNSAQEHIRLATGKERRTLYEALAKDGSAKSKEVIRRFFKDSGFDPVEEVKDLSLSEDGKRVVFQAGGKYCQVSCARLRRLLTKNKK